MKAIYPVLKEKKRYILLKIHSEENFNFSTISSELKKGFKEFLGEFEMSKAGIILLRETWNSKSKTFIVRVGIKHVDALKSAIMFIKTIKNKPVIISSVKTSGKLNKLKYFQKR